MLLLYLLTKLENLLISNRTRTKYYLTIHNTSRSFITETGNHILRMFPSPSEKESNNDFPAGHPSLLVAESPTQETSARSINGSILPAGSVLPVDTAAGLPTGRPATCSAVNPLVTADRQKSHNGPILDATWRKRASDDTTFGFDGGGTTLSRVLSQ